MNLALNKLQLVGRDIRGDKYSEVIDAVIDIFFSARFALRPEILPVLPRS
jgi:hypothetical protein